MDDEDAENDADAEMMEWFMNTFRGLEFIPAYLFVMPFLVLYITFRNVMISLVDFISGRR